MQGTRFLPTSPQVIWIQSRQMYLPWAALAEVNIGMFIGTSFSFMVLMFWKVKLFTDIHQSRYKASARQILTLRTGNNKQRVREFPAHSSILAVRRVSPQSSSR